MKASVPLFPLSSEANVKKQPVLDALQIPGVLMSFLLCRVRECGLTAACCKAVSSVLSVNKHLQVLHIGENKLGNAGVEILCEGLLHPNCNIHSLW